MDDERGMDIRRLKSVLLPWVTQNTRDGVERSLATEEIPKNAQKVDPPLVNRVITAFSYAWSSNSPGHPGGAYMTDMSGDGGSEKSFLRIHGRSERSDQDGSMELVSDQRWSTPQMINRARNVVRAPKHRPSGDAAIYIGKSR